MPKKLLAALYKRSQGDYWLDADDTAGAAGIFMIAGADIIPIAWKIPAQIAEQRAGGEGGDDQSGGGGAATARGKGAKKHPLAMA
jgi:hypothetical protein